MSDKPVAGDSADNTTSPVTNPEATEEETQPSVPKVKCVTLSAFGGSKMVKASEKPLVTPKDGEVSIRVKACGLNFMDLMVRQGVIDNPPKTPITMGFECSGEVDIVGEGVTKFKPGDRVIAFINYSAWSEVVIANENHVYKMPEQMSFQDGAALPMNYLSAFMMLFELGNLKPGKSVLVHSVGGGVGHAVSQLCSTLDDVTLFGTSSTAKHESIKANVTHLFDHTKDYTQEVRKISPEGVDIVLDCLCGDDANKGISLLKPMGKYILYGSSNIVTGETKSFFSFAKSWWQVDKISPIKLYDENKSIAGFQLRQLAFKQNQYTYIERIMGQLIELYTAGKIHPVIDTVFAFEDVTSAMQRLQDRKNIGKVILDPSLQPKQQADGACVTGEGKETEETRSSE